MNFKKKVSGSWVDAPYYLKSTDTETITTLPATIYPLAQSVTLSLKGNTVQNGTPTPDNPVPVVGVGDDDNGQIKIPISSANTTTPIYLGEVQTTRKIKKLVLTGEENITSTHTDIRLFNIPITDYLKNVGVVTNICSHYIAGINVNGWSDVTDMTSRFYGNAGSLSKLLYIRDSSYTTVADFKSYLAAQYASGTPVTVWYVLATEETAVVNEPLMKIGDYTDEVPGISIPTIAGANTLSVDTTVQPSEVTANYHGWHPVANVHERESGQWT